MTTFLYILNIIFTIVLHFLIVYEKTDNTPASILESCCLLTSVSRSYLRCPWLWFLWSFRSFCWHWSRGMTIPTFSTAWLVLLVARKSALIFQYLQRVYSTNLLFISASKSEAVRVFRRAFFRENGLWCFFITFHHVFKIP